MRLKEEKKEAEMGGRSSKFVKKYEYHTNMNQVQQILEELKQAQSNNNDELSRNFRKLQTEINALQSFQQKHVKSLIRTEEQQNAKNTNLSGQLKELCNSLNQVSVEHKEDRIKFPGNINNEIVHQRKKWAEDVVDLRERMEGLKTYSMELISMDLAHEREIKDLQKRIRYLEDKLIISSSETKLDSIVFQQKDSAVNASTHSNWDMSQKASAVTASESCSQCGREMLEGGKNKSSSFFTSSSYDLKSSKINMAMKKLKDDIKYAEIKRIKSSS